MWRTTNGEVPWTALASPNNHKPGHSPQRCEYTLGSKGKLTASGSKVYKSTNGWVPADQYFGHPAQHCQPTALSIKTAARTVYMSMDMVFITATIPCQVGCCSIRRPICRVTELEIDYDENKNFCHHLRQGSLVIWSLNPWGVSNPRFLSQSLECRYDLAVANPSVAPFGAMSGASTQM